VIIVFYFIYLFWYWIAYNVLMCHEEITVIYWCLMNEVYSWSSMWFVVRLLLSVQQNMPECFQHRPSPRYILFHLCLMLIFVFLKLDFWKHFVRLICSCCYFNCLSSHSCSFFTRKYCVWNQCCHWHVCNELRHVSKLRQHSCCY